MAPNLRRFRALFMTGLIAPSIGAFAGPAAASGVAIFAL